MSDRDISVAIQYPGSRANRITYPFSKTDIDFEVSADKPFDFDIVLLDCPSLRVLKPLAKAKFSDTPVVYRVQGDILRAFQEMNYTSFKYRSAKYLFSHLDGAIPIEPILGKRFSNLTGVKNIGTATLAKEGKYWPDVKHWDESLRLISVTNVNYIGKVQPMIDYAPYISRFLQRNGGHWNIYGKGRLAKYLQDNLDKYDNISYCGYAEDIKPKYANSNCMLHLSNFDSLPNAILEGFASNMPVITNPFSVFSDYHGPIEVTELKKIDAKLCSMQDPTTRRIKARQGQEYLKAKHTPEIVGEQYSAIFRSVLK